VSAGLAGLGVPYVLPIGLWVLAVASTVTFFQRVVAARRSAAGLAARTAETADSGGTADAAGTTGPTLAAGGSTGATSASAGRSAPADGSSAASAVAAGRAATARSGTEQRDAAPGG
jgi:hypothetical protein